MMEGGKEKRNKLQMRKNFLIFYDKEKVSMPVLFSSAPFVVILETAGLCCVTLFLTSLRDLPIHH